MNELAKVNELFDREFQKNTPAIYRNEACDSVEIKECKAVLRGDTLKLPNMQMLADAIADRSDWVQLAYMLAEHVQDLRTYINEDRAKQKTTAEWHQINESTKNRLFDARQLSLGDIKCI